jgi:hypothetical protein
MRLVERGAVGDYGIGESEGVGDHIREKRPTVMMSEFSIYGMK